MWLGHGGDPCSVPSDFVENFIIVDTTSIHLTDVHFCGCYAIPGGSHPRVQLLCTGLFLGTFTRLTTAFTFDVLDSFHLLTLQSKISAYDYFNSIAHKTENTGRFSTKVCSYLITQKKVKLNISWPIMISTDTNYF